MGYSASVALELSFDDNHHLPLQRIFDESVLRCYSLALRTLHKLSAENHYVATVFDKDSVAKNEVLAPKEQIVLVAMFYWANRAFVWALNTLHHLVDLKCIALGVSSPKSAAAGRSWQFLSKVCNLDIFDLALLIY